MKVLDKVRQKVQGQRHKSLTTYRDMVGRVAAGKTLKSADSDKLAQLLGVLGITPEQVERDADVLRRHRELSALAASDDPDVLAAQARDARQSAEDHRVAARKAEQAALSLDAQLRAHAHRQHELRELERRNARLFASDIDVALAQPPKAEDSERPPERPEHASVGELIVRQHAERAGWPPVVLGGRP